MMVQNLYFPSQPDLTRFSSSYKEFRPIITSIPNNIAVYYEFTTNDKAEIPICLIPDGCFDLLFYLDENYPAVYLWTTPFSKKEQNFLQREGFYFGVRFQPEQNLVFFKEHMHDLIEQVIPLQSLLTFDESIIESLLTAQNLQQRINIFNTFLTTIQQESKRETFIIKHVVDKIYELQGQCSLKMVAESAGFSQQYIRRVFERFIGLSPKQFAQIIQLQQTLQVINFKQDIDLQDIAFHAGYYDQAHFIKTFKKFMHTTPKKYFKNTHQSPYNVNSYPKVN